MNGGWKPRSSAGDFQAAVSQGSDTQPAALRVCLSPHALSVCVAAVPAVYFVVNDAVGGVLQSGLQVIT